MVANSRRNIVSKDKKKEMWGIYTQDTKDGNFPVDAATESLSLHSIEVE